ncbi:ABC transporter substrate-binding protein [Variovorax sp. J22R115]|uniref:ABC transporter substrate-binding protein n=1 Tax=Variovorax sp. J22R115 TaxID=3053509 RepID=UPI002574BB55|nr:ABC transporter substrate-binding protein [Variovorax sp. J22R115]MDM0050595.1 ABC transporter substrate-binding protein [Variovorax sp. J22R115]
MFGTVSTVPELATRSASVRMSIRLRGANRLRGKWPCPTSPCLLQQRKRNLRGGSEKGRRRCALNLVVSLLAVSIGAGTQGRAHMPRIGILSYVAAPSGTSQDPRFAGFRKGLRELGYMEKKNILIELRYAEGQPDRLAAQAAELVQLNVDVLVAFGPAAREAARKATSTIPIVTVSGSDPIREGWARSFAHPGGNVTGLTVVFPELVPKCLEFLKEAFPAVVRVAVLIDPTEVVDAKEVVQEMDDGARRLGLQLQVLEVRGPNDFDAAFTLARQRNAQALFPLAAVAHRSRLATLALRDHLLSISEFPLMTQAGFLMSYGADLDDLGRRAVTKMDKILKGEHPGDVPIERPTKFQLSINLKTAKALGIEIPRSLLLRANEVIE